VSARSFRRAYARRVARERRRVAQARQRALVAGATLGATAVFAANAEAATYIVNSTADDGTGTCNPSPGACTLRDAVTTANANGTVGTPDTVDLSGVSGTITLDPTKAVIGITDPGGLNINGPGPGTLTVSGGNATGIFQINPGAGAVSISGLTLTAGSSAANGGAIDDTGAPLTLTNVTISGNAAAGSGGGVYSERALTISASTITGNTADTGGGIATSGKYNVAIENSTISGNTAATGGGIFAFLGSLSLTQSTISGNTSSQDGGGIHSQAKYDTTIDNSTIAQNAAAGSGGGIYLAQFGDQSGTAAINSTIVADNTAGGAPNDLFLQGTPAGGGFNNTFSLIENPGDAPLIDSHALITDVDPQLGLLADNGGPTETMLPSNTSPVIDQGNAQGLTTDQRGRPRTVNNGRAVPPEGDGTDIGAVELPLIPPAPPPPPPPPPPTPPAAVTTPTPPIVVITQCKSRRHFIIRLIERRGRLIRSAKVFVRGRRVAVVRRRSDRRLVAVVDLRGLPEGTYRVVIKARLRNGLRARWVRSYRTCIGRLPPSNDLDNPRAL
jgi:CSLREA domain-containing protein